MDIFKRQEVTNRTWQWIILWGLHKENDKEGDSHYGVFDYTGDGTDP